MTVFLSVLLVQATAEIYNLSALEFFLTNSNKIVFELPFVTILKFFFSET